MLWSACQTCARTRAWQADCMTKDELKSFRKTVRETLETANRAYGREVMYKCATLTALLALP